MNFHYFVKGKIIIIINIFTEGAVLEINLDFDLNVTNTLQAKMKELKLPQDLIADLLEMKLPTLRDKLSNKTIWKASEVARIAQYFGITTDIIIFGDKDYILKLKQHNQQEIKQRIKDFLLNDKDYKTYGELQSKGYFKEIEK